MTAIDLPTDLTDLTVVPCPFCGSTVINIALFPGLKIPGAALMCSKCGCIGPKKNNDIEMAITRWNERHQTVSKSI